MTGKKSRRAGKPRGFTLVELLVVVLIIGILAAIAVPQYFKVVEKGKFAEVMATFDSVRSAQERYMAATGGYCIDSTFATCPGWDLPIPTLNYFDVTKLTLAKGACATTACWKGTLTRNAAPAVYGAYVVTYDVEAGAKPAITCSQASCTTDLLPQ